MLVRMIKIRLFRFVPEVLTKMRHKKENETESRISENRPCGIRPGNI